MGNLVGRIMEAIRNAVRFTLVAVCKGGKWTLETVAEVVPATFRLVGGTASAVGGVLGALVPRKAAKPPADQAKAEPEAAKAVDVSGALSVKAAARALLKGETPQGVPAEVLAALQALDRPHLEAVARAGVEAVAGLLAQGNAAPVAKGREQMLAELRADLLSGRVGGGALRPKREEPTATQVAAKAALSPEEVAGLLGKHPGSVLRRNKKVAAPA